MTQPVNKRERKESEVGQLKSCPPLNPLSGYYSKAVVAATLSCKSSPPRLRYKRGCAAHGAWPTCSFLLNRMAPGAAPRFDNNNLWTHSFVPRHHFAPLHQPHKNPTHFKKAANNNNKTSALRLDALQNDGFQKENHIYTG